MEDIHPHWRATDDDQNIVISSQQEPTKVVRPTQQKSISRRPAAVVGIALVLGIGFYLFRDSTNLVGQVSSSLVIHVTENGFNPATLTVKPGDTITFMNESPTQQIVGSETLCSSTGYCLYTSTLSPGDSENFTITQEFTAGTYTYRSSGNGEILGEIIISSVEPVPTAPTIPQNSRVQFQPVTTSIEQAINGTGIFDSTPTATPPSTRLPSDFLTNSDQTAVQANIPQNPYALGSTRVHPFDQTGEPIEELFENAHSGAPRPISQPDTGPGLWAVILLSMVGILFAARRALKQEVIYTQL